MNCPRCEHPKSRVDWTVAAEQNTIKRTRKCLQCSHGWFTFEVISPVPVKRRLLNKNLCNKIVDAIRSETFKRGNPKVKKY